MRKVVLLASLVAAIATCGLLLGTTVAGASSDNAAVQYVSCPDTSFTSTLGSFTFNYCFFDVSNSSGNANAVFQGTLVDGSTAPSKATTFTGFGCSAAFPGGGFTTDTRAVITPSGNVNGNCKFHPSS
jgi:hypothetical protein